MRSLPAQPKDILFPVFQLLLQRLAVVLHRVNLSLCGLQRTVVVVRQMSVGGAVAARLDLRGSRSCVHGDVAG